MINTSPSIITIEMVEIHPFEHSDIPNLISWIDSPEAALLWASKTFPYPLSIAQVEKHLSRSHENGTSLRIFKITCNKKTVGHIELSSINLVVKSAAICRLFIAPAERKQGLARQALLQVLKLGFQELELNRIVIQALIKNQAAFRLYSALGFEHEKDSESSHFLAMSREKFFSQYSHYDFV